MRGEGAAARLRLTAGCDRQEHRLDSAVHRAADRAAAVVSEPRIVGVVSDFTLGSIRTAIDPTMYFVYPITAQLLLAKVQGGRRRDCASARVKAAGGIVLIDTPPAAIEVEQ